MVGSIPAAEAMAHASPERSDGLSDGVPHQPKRWRMHPRSDLMASLMASLISRSDGACIPGAI